MAARLGERRRMADVVRFWRAVELFSPQKVPAVRPQEQVFAVRPGRPLPWEDPTELPALRPRHTWQHTVYCGVFPVDRVRDVLAEVFPDAATEDRDGRLGGSSALMSFTVNQDGLLLEDSVCVSSCAWAVGRTRAPGPDDARWLEDFDEEAAACEQRMLDLGDGRLTVRGGRSGGAGLLAMAGTLVADSVTGGMVSGLGVLARGLVGEAVGGVVGQAVQTAAGQTVEALAEGTFDRLRGRETGEPGADARAEHAEADEDEDEDEEPKRPVKLGTCPVTLDGVAAITAWLAERFKVTVDLAPDAARVRSVQVRGNRGDETVSEGFLNSFIAEDLSRVADELGEGRAGRALAAYLTEADRIDIGRRRDVQDHPEQVLEGISPQHVPLGRWPSASDQSLVLSQQFAVNRLLGELGAASGVFSVNGPPGTGKTTMLRDVIAALVTQRACALAELRSPQEAFGETHTWRSEQYARTVRELAPQLAGYEIVVASANNGAVENITDEIPSRGAIAAQWHGEADYLAEQASLMLGGEPAWGAIAARLGNRKNRGEFVQSFWWGNLRTRTSNGAHSRATPTNRGLWHELGGRRKPVGQSTHGALDGRQAAPVDWAESARRFKAARRQVEELRDRRQRAAEALGGLAGLRQELAEAVRNAAAAAEDLPALRQQGADAQRETERLEEAERVCRERRRDHQAGQPRLLQSIFTGGRSNRLWQDEYERLSADVERAAQAASAARGRYQDAADTIAAAQRLVDAAETRRHAVDAVEQEVRGAQGRWGPHMPAPTDFTADADRQTVERREKSSPWADVEFAQARTRLFLEALRLHRAFLSAAGDTMARNLQAAMEVVGGGAPKDLAPAAVRAAWQTLFLTVPVVSTTFASYDRLFAGLGREDLGWLFVDEAGQASPQMPVGALWRTRRAVVVGDPLQLEPVVVLPWTAQQRLREHLHVAQEWAPSWTSAQQVADRLGRWGTTLPASSPDGPTQVWVGSPLRVHRRCDDPMFTVSNTIAYGGLMVHGVGDRGDFRPPRESFWWHVRSSQAEGKWVPAEGRALVTAVERLRREGLPNDQLYVISPFRDVATHAAERLRGLVPWDRVGTVHTAQGKEADVVILVLGTHPDANGARRWAAAKPNLLNVAVSRAKRRFIVIGDNDSWRGQLHFSVLADQLRRVDHQE
ncbi:DEAD/DEAH box helicase [Streptomyces sp. NBC_01190]|uniref:DEAD/DEAH box helicase n=1 Tax=Streptomyces sp. NBC_01190 TaxID=2903767 RepID=UPI003867574C|nr:AAA domain-containing protein [Streptomyces sp. NBC_01190]